MRKGDAKLMIFSQVKDCDADADVNTALGGGDLGPNPGCILI